MIYNFCTFLKTPKRVDMYISALFDELSRSYVQKLIDSGCVLLNGEACKKNIKLHNKDTLEITIKTESVDIMPENMGLDIVFEDENMIVINKEAGVNVHPVPGEGGKSGTLVNALLYHCRDALPVISGEERPGIVHRLDKDTSGLIMIAKNDKMMHYLANTIKDRQIEKYYIAVVYGMVKNTDIHIESFLGRDRNNRQRMSAQNPINPKLASTRAKVIDYIDNRYTVLKVKLETGRTHQIRVHLASIGYPIIGDSVYGNCKANIEAKTRYQIKRQALHAYTLDLELYDQKKNFLAPLKPDMIRLIGNITL